MFHTQPVPHPNVPRSICVEKPRDETKKNCAFPLGRGAWPMPMIRSLFLGDESVFDPDGAKRLRLLYTITLVRGRDYGGW